MTTIHVYTPTQAAIAAYVAYRDDAGMFEPPPVLDQVRLVAQYCQDFIESPRLFASDDVLELRRRVVHIRTLDDLERWLWDCRKIGIEPL